MRFHQIVYGVGLIVLTCACTSMAVEFYVSPRGVDIASGTAQKPFATVHRALQAMRELRKMKPAEPVVVRIAAGRYELGETISLTAADTTAPVRFEGAGTGKTILSGARRLSGWKVGIDGRSWTVTLPEVEKGRWQIEQLYVNNRRVLRPSLPRDSYFSPEGLAPGRTNAAPTRFTACAGDIDSAWTDLTNTVEIVVMHGWNITRARIAEYDAQTREVRMTTGRGGFMRDLTAKSLYRLENVQAAYGEVPGEWYCDAQTGVLSYLPLEGENVSTSDVYAPYLKCLVSLAGTSAKKVKDVTFRNLTFAHQAESLEGAGTMYHQVSSEAGGAIRVEQGENIHLKACDVRHVGGWAVQFMAGCLHCSVTEGTLFDLGAGGVQMGVRTRAHGTQTTDCRVENCLISGYGRVQPGATGVGILHADKCQVVHNTIRDGYYSGVSVGYSWRYGCPTAAGTIIEGNHIYDIGQRVLSDMAGVYTLGEQPGSVFRGNLIHDIVSARYGAHGFYFDNGSGHITVSNNVVTRAADGVVKIGGLNKNILLANNVFLFARSYMMWPTADREKSENIRVERNIFQWDEECARIFGWDPSSFRMTFASNVWWQAAWPEKIWFRKKGGTNRFDIVEEPSPPARWKRWHRLAQPSSDVAAWLAAAPGDVIADPRLSAPYAGRDHLRPLPDSPAIARGFVPFELKGRTGCANELSDPFAERATRTFPEQPLRASHRVRVATERAKRELRMVVFNQRYLLGGAGFAVAFITPSGKVYFFDLGNGGKDPVAHNCGRDTLMPWLHENDIREISGVVVSHAHGDHFGGLFGLWNRYPLSRFWDNGYQMPGSVPGEIGGEVGCIGIFRERLRAVNPDLICRSVRRGAMLDWDPELRVTVITPPVAGFPLLENPKRPKNDQPWHHLVNANALGLRVEYGETSFQIMGDIQADYESKFLLPTLPPEWRKVDVLLTCGHGIHSTKEEAEFFRPKIAVGCVFQDGAPAGWCRTWAESLPIYGVYRAVGAEVYVTGMDGNVTVISDGKKCRVETQYGANRRKRLFKR